MYYVINDLKGIETITIFDNIQDYINYNQVTYENVDDLEKKTYCLYKQVYNSYSNIKENIEFKINEEFLNVHTVDVRDYSNVYNNIIVKNILDEDLYIYQDYGNDHFHCNKSIKYFNSDDISWSLGFTKENYYFIGKPLYDKNLIVINLGKHDSIDIEEHWENTKHLKRPFDIQWYKGLNFIIYNDLYTHKITFKN
jgi:hypothetical protein